MWNLGGRKGLSFYTPEVVDEVAEQAVGRALTLFDAVQPPAGEMPVVLGPGVTGVLLHEAIGHGMEADFNRKKISTYCTMIGKKVAEPFVTIVDDGTNLGLTGSLNVDDEGTPGQKTVLMDEGVLRSYMHDKISAKHYGVDAHRERPPRELRALRAAADEKHVHVAGARRGGRRDPKCAGKASTCRTWPTARSRSAKAISPSTCPRDE